jgi:hypothetical protein
LCLLLGGGGGYKSDLTPFFITGYRGQEEGLGHDDDLEAKAAGRRK